MTTEERYRAILANHLPDAAVDWVYNYLNLHKVHFHITLERRSKLGDYRWPQPGRDQRERTAFQPERDQWERTAFQSAVSKRNNHESHEISINGDLNPYFFLWVFLHEAAHLETHLKHNDAQPHGYEWQAEYARLIAAHADFFPPEVQPLLARYVRRIPLNRSLLRQIEASLHRYDPGYNEEQHITLDTLSSGTRFRMKAKPQLLFEAIEKRRTRWLCRELSSNRRYLVNGGAEVIVEQ